MTDTFRELCAELVETLHGYASANPHHDSDELVARARTLLAQPEPVALTDEENLLLSVARCIAFHPCDWGLDHRDAWLHGIVCGWGDALQEVAERHRWGEATVERLQRPRAAAIAAELSPTETTHA